MGSAGEWECHCVLHEPPESGKPLDEQDHQRIEIIEEQGWVVTLVMGDEVTRPFGYTTGLWHSFGVPELCMFGLELDDIHAVLNGGASMLRDGWQPNYDEHTDELLEGFPVAVRPVLEEWYVAFFGWAVWFAQAPPLPFLQLMYPDPTGAFPDEAPVQEGFEEMQPILSIPVAEHPTSPWMRAVE